MRKASAPWCLISIPSQVDALRKFGFKVFYGDALRLDLLESAGAKEAKVMVIAIDDREKITELVKIAKHNFPHLKLLVRVYDRAHAYEVMREGVDDVYREVFGSSMDLAQTHSSALGRHPYEAKRAITRFRAHDERFLRKSAAHAERRKQAHRYRPPVTRRNHPRLRRRQGGRGNHPRYGMA